MEITACGSFGEGCINRKVLATPSWPILFPPSVVSLAKGEAKLLGNIEKCWTTVCYLTRCIKYPWHLEYDWQRGHQPGHQPHTCSGRSSEK